MIWYWDPGPRLRGDPLVSVREGKESPPMSSRHMERPLGVKSAVSERERERGKESMSEFI